MNGVFLRNQRMVSCDDAVFPSAYGCLVLSGLGAPTFSINRDEARQGATIEVRVSLTIRGGFNVAWELVSRREAQGRYSPIY